MALAPTIIYTAAGGADNLSGIQAGATTTPTQLDSIERTVAAGLTNQTFTINIDVSQLQTLFIYTDTTATIYTNATSGGAPAHTLNFVANKPLAWVNGCPNANPFASTDVTTFYITNGNTASVLTVRGVVSQNI
jgi:hypothetical protein